MLQLISSELTFPLNLHLSDLLLNQITIGKEDFYALRELTSVRTDLNGLYETEEGPHPGLNPLDLL